MTLIWIATRIAFSSAQVVADDSNRLPNEESYLYRPVPDISVRSAHGGDVHLSELWSDRPLLITLVFTRCAGICYPFLRSLRSAAGSFQESPPSYRILVLSFDSRDAMRDMEAAAATLGAAEDHRWIFGTTSIDSIRALSEATGFWFRWDNKKQQYDHPAVLVTVYRGRVARLFAGARIRPATFRAMLREMQGGFVASYPLPGTVMFRCFQYDATSRSLSLDWGALLLVLPGTIALLAAVVIFQAGRSSHTESPAKYPGQRCNTNQGQC